MFLNAQDLRLQICMLLGVWAAGLTLAVVSAVLLIKYLLAYANDPAGVRDRRQNKLGCVGQQRQPPRLHGAHSSPNHPSVIAAHTGLPDAHHWVPDIDQLSSPFEILRRYYGAEKAIALSNVAVYAGLSINQLLERRMTVIACAEARRLARKRLTST